LESKKQTASSDMVVPQFNRIHPVVEVVIVDYEVIVSGSRPLFDPSVSDERIQIQSAFEQSHVWTNCKLIGPRVGGIEKAGIVRHWIECRKEAGIPFPICRGVETYEMYVVIVVEARRLHSLSLSEPNAVIQTSL
jgi:hypothetical protein